jgi:hypothetical protein
MIWLVGAGLFALAIYNSLDAPEDYGPLWRVFGGIAAAMYLCWLAAMLFDLVFVWHRYIRCAVAMKFLRAEVARADLGIKGDSPERPRPGTDRDRGDDDSTNQGGAPANIPPIAPSGAPATVAWAKPTHEDRGQPVVG